MKQAYLMGYSEPSYVQSPIDFTIHRIKVHKNECTKNINSGKNWLTKLWFSDESSLFTGLWGLFLAQRMFFEQNKYLQWIQKQYP